MPIALTITPVIPVTLLFCDIATAPIWVGYQDGNGPWQEVVGVNHSFTVRLAAPRAGIAFVRSIGTPAPQHDLFAALMRVGGGQEAARVIIRRGTNYPAGSVIPTLNLGSGEAVTANVRSVTVNALGGEAFELRENYVTANGTVGPLALLWPYAPVNPFITLPAAVAAAGDVYNLRVETEPAAATSVRMAIKSFAEASNQTIDLGPVLREPEVFMLRAAPFFQVRVVSVLQPEYDRVFTGRYAQRNRTGTVYITSGWLGGAALDVTTPDLTQVPGWQSYGPLPGINTVLTATAYGWTGADAMGLRFPLLDQDVLFQAGLLVRSASLSKMIVP